MSHHLPIACLHFRSVRAPTGRVALLGAFLLAGVSACNSGSSSSSTPSTSPAPPAAPTAPAGFSAAAGNTQVTLTWSDVTGATGYNLYWGKATGVTPQTGTQIAGVTSPYAHTALTNGTTYYYLATATNAGGESPASAESSATPQIPAPGAPKNLAAAAGYGQVSLSWDAVTGATGYNVYRSTKSGGGTSGTQLPSASNSYVDFAVTGGTAEYYVVTALNAGGESAASPEAGATPQAAQIPCTSGTPLAADTPTQGVVGPFGTNCYTLTTAPGTTYAIALYELTANVDLFVSADGMSGTQCSAGKTVQSGPTPEDCVITATGTSLQVKAAGIVGGSYMLLATTQVGTADSPHDENQFQLTAGVAHAAGLLFRGSSVSSYEVSGFSEPVSIVAFGVQGLNVDLTAYSDDKLSLPLTCDEPLPGSNSSRACTLYHPPATFYITIQNSGCDCIQQPTTYTILAASANRTLSSVNSLAVDTPTTGTTQPGAVTVYQLTSPGAATTYTATAYGMNSGYVALLGSWDNTSSRSCTRSNSAGINGPVDCALTTVEAGTPSLYFWVVGAPGGNYTIQVDALPIYNSPSSDDGASDGPTAVTYNTPYASYVSADGFDSYYSIDVSGASGPVVVSLSQVQSDSVLNGASMQMYSDNFFRTPLACDGGTPTHSQSQAPADCILNSPVSPVRVKVFGADSAGNPSAAQYVLTVSPWATGTVNLPAGTTPTTLTLDTPMAGTVTWGSYTPYLVKGLTPGSNYVAGIAGLSADLSELGFVGMGCSINNTSHTGTVPQDCIAPATGPNDLIAIGGYDEFGVGQSGRFEVLAAPQSAPPQSVSSEGSVDAPMLLTSGSAHAGVVPMCNNSYYKVTGLTGATLVSLTGINGGTLTPPAQLNALLTVTTDSSFASVPNCSGSAGFLPQDVIVDATTVAAADGTLYVAVSEVLDANNTGFTLTVQPAP